MVQRRKGAMGEWYGGAMMRLCEGAKAWSHGVPLLGGGRGGLNMVQWCNGAMA